MEGPIGHGVVRQRRLSDQVADAIRDEILSRSLKPGDRLSSERILGEQFGVSRTVVREAIRALTAKGLVNSKNGSGLSVGTVDLADISESMRLYMHGGGKSLRYLDLHEVRTVLEAAIASSAAEHASADQCGLLLTLCDDMAASADDVAAASQLDLLFHRTLALATHNEFYVLLHDFLGEALMETRLSTFAFDPSRMPRVACVHRDIAQAVKNRDPAAAQELMLEHLEDVKATWLRDTSHDT